MYTQNIVFSIKSFEYYNMDTTICQLYINITNYIMYNNMERILYTM